MKDWDRTILLVEDNEDDVFALQRSLKKAGIANPLQVVKDGQQAVDYLSGNGCYAERGRFPMPFIVFLDLKLPYVSGFEVLKWIRGQAALDALVVIILTSSDEDRDHHRAYELGARSYLVKPPTPEGLIQLANSLQSLWGPTANGPILLEKSAR